VKSAEQYGRARWAKIVAYKRRWSRANKDRIKSYGRKYYLSHKNQIRQRTDAWKASHPEEVLAMARKSQAKIRSEKRLNRPVKVRKPKRSAEETARVLKKRKRQWVAQNQEWIREYNRRRYKENIQHCLKRRLSARLSKLLSRSGARKHYSTEILIGTSLAALKLHIEANFKPGMSWKNRHLWHIDHKKPCSSFDLSDPKQQFQCFNYTNLQPLWAVENMQKSDKIFAA
jgi:hypothetical protein